MRELRDDRHAEGAANAVVVKEFVPFKGVGAGRARHRKTKRQQIVKSSNAWMEEDVVEEEEGRRLSESERERRVSRVRSHWVRQVVRGEGKEGRLSGRNVGGSAFALSSPST